MVDRGMEAFRTDTINQEVRVPLSAIAGLSTALADRLEGVEAEMARLIATSCERLVRKLDALPIEPVEEQPKKGPHFRDDY